MFYYECVSFTLRYLCKMFLYECVLFTLRYLCKMSRSLSDIINKHIMLTEGLNFQLPDSALK